MTLSSFATYESASVRELRRAALIYRGYRADFAERAGRLAPAAFTLACRIQADFFGRELEVYTERFRTSVAGSAERAALVELLTDLHGCLSLLDRGGAAVIDLDLAKLVSEGARG